MLGCHLHIVGWLDTTHGRKKIILGLKDNMTMALEVHNNAILLDLDYAG